MAKKVKFALQMSDGEQVRTLEELREHFDLESVLNYYENGRLYEWLIDRYYDEEAEKINVLDFSASDFKKKLCEVLEVPYLETEAKRVDLSDISKRNERREFLKRFTSDDVILDSVDRVAFSQEELDFLIDKGIKEIYLCGDYFKISKNRENITFIGLNLPELDVPDEFAEKNIVFHGVRLSGVSDIIWKARGTKETVEAAKLWKEAAEIGSSEAQYQLGICYYNGKGVKQDYIEAIKWIRRAADKGHLRAQKTFWHNGHYFNDFQKCISVFPLIGLKKDGTVVENQETSQNWHNIVAVSSGGRHIVGLKSDGTVVAIGDNDCGQCDVLGWSNIIVVSACRSITYGLKSDGTVVSTSKDYYGIEKWYDIIDIDSSDDSIVGLKSDGTVVAAGRNDYGQCDVQDWQNIIAISAGDAHTVGLKKDGIVIVAGSKLNPDVISTFKPNPIAAHTQEWHDIIAVSAGRYHTVGLKSDGTVIAVGDNDYGQCDVQDWKDIIAISAFSWGTVGVKKDGTICATSFWRPTPNWNDIGLVLNESEFCQRACCELVCNIIYALGGEANIRTCDLRLLEKGQVKIYVYSRYKVNVSALEEIGAKKVIVKPILSTEKSDLSGYLVTRATYDLKSILKRAISPVIEEVDRGNGIIDILFPNTNQNIRRGFEYNLVPSKFGAIEG